jgi:hypothetical protein
MGAAAQTSPRAVQPVLDLPQPGLDDSAAYQGYATRFYRDAAGNTVQIYLDRRQGRVVHVIADADNASIGFSVRAPGGGEVPIRWDDSAAIAERDGRRRTLTYRLVVDAPSVELGWFLLGSMRVERDLQYAGRHREPFTTAPFVPQELDRLIAAIGALPQATQRAHLALLHAPDTSALRRRLGPAVLPGADGAPFELVQPSLDGRDTMALQLRIVPADVQASLRESDGAVQLRARAGTRVAFAVRISTTGAPLTALSRDEIFTREFLDFVASEHAAARAGNADARRRAAWLERNVRGVELLSSREKLMAGMPTYATYFGRDMLVSALMMRPIWRDEMSEFAVAAALRKLSPTGQVSHEEALGGQADREAAAEYADLVGRWRQATGRGDRAAADSLLARAGDVLRNHRRVRENYHMIDDELQLPVLAGRWLADPRVPAARKQAFLRDSSDGGGTRLARLLRELALVARMTAPYAADPRPANLVSFPARDSGWASSSWRDSNAGYGGGRYAMDVNAIWAPHALESVGRILEALRSLGWDADALARLAPEAAADQPLGRYARDAGTLRAATDAWAGAWRHFVVALGPDEVRTAVGARLAAMPADERAHWERVVADTRAADDSLTFLALALDAAGRPIGIANTDPATRLFLGDTESGVRRDSASSVQQLLRDVQLFTRPYPVGLHVDAVGPVVANDAYSTPDVWDRFVKDPYHGPRVVWGREVNLFLLGVTDRLAVGRGSSGGRALPPPVAEELRRAIDRVRTAVEASGFRSELWSYDFTTGRPRAVRYGSGGDIQLWSTTDLAVQYALWRLAR